MNEATLAFTNVQMKIIVHVLDVIGFKDCFKHLTKSALSSFTRSKHLDYVSVIREIKKFRNKEK